MSMPQLAIALQTLYLAVSPLKKKMRLTTEKTGQVEAVNMSPVYVFKSSEQCQHASAPFFTWLIFSHLLWLSMHL